MPLNAALVQILSPAYGPCPAFSTFCSEMRWNPAHGHVPRGFLGASGDTSEVELVLVFAEPGDPHDGETHELLRSAYDYAVRGFGEGMDQFHRNVRGILDSCWPNLPFEQQLRKVWMTESVLCSAKTEGGAVEAMAARECGRRYLLAQLSLFPNALVVALGQKAQHRLRALGFTRFLPAYAVAPPGCNRSVARESWAQIPRQLLRVQHGGA